MPIELTTYRPDSVWAIDETPEARAARRAVTYRTWVTLEDRSFLLNYVMEWKDVNGYGLHVTHAPACGYVAPRSPSTYRVNVTPAMVKDAG